MTDHIRLAKNRLFGEEHGLAVSDFKMFPGTNRDVSMDEFAEQITKSLADIEAGDYELVDEFED